MEKTPNIYTALLSLQSELQPIIKNAKNDFHKNKYADINKILEFIKPVLTKNELVLLQPIVEDEKGNKLITILHHVNSGTEIRSEMRLIDFNDSQKVGSNITYFRRYSLVSLLSLEAEDDDGNASSGVNNKLAEKNKRQNPVPPTPASGKTFEELITDLEQETNPMKVGVIKNSLSLMKDKLSTEQKAQARKLLEQKIKPSQS